MPLTFLVSTHCHDHWLLRTKLNLVLVAYNALSDGLDDWASHLFFLTDKGSCGWQGRMEDLDVYQKLKAEQHPAKMLSIAEYWLRKEMEAKRALNRKEKAARAYDTEDLLDRTQGGYSSGRMETDEEATARKNREAKLLKST